jgi:6-phosphogluconolactonase
MGESSVKALRVFPNADLMARMVAAEIADHLEGVVDERGWATVAAAGGQTPRATYGYLARLPISWRRILVTLTDERFVDADPLDSNEQMLRETLLRHRAAEATFLPLMRDAGPSAAGQGGRLGLPATAQWADDLILLGMGEDGHVASLFAGGQSPDEGMHIDGEKRCVSVPAGRSSSAHPGVSLTLSSIASARRVILAITGRVKRRTVERAISDDLFNTMPVSAVLRHARNISVVWAP